MPPTARRLAAGPCKKAAVAAAMVLLVGCGAEEPPAPAPVPEGLGEVTVGADGVQEVTLQTQDDYLFTPDTFTVEPGRVRLTVVNVAEEMPHNLEFTDDELPAPVEEGISMLAAGEEETIEFEVTTPGDYPFSCTFHVQLGQVGTMTVSG
ncbi:plastocyanin/azurin family copper-binding protein [Blastococcus saxobsidens]|uniref:plastocyanin/azurin family copper-binding protein n=1 Tax=Blastococcus saxobsidens TaxID=138336 RepID=UPI001F5E4DEB|nr:plastocyanin/azurin family copper-binding protein [Blastococcus saxobsidens]